MRTKAQSTARMNLETIQADEPTPTASTVEASGRKAQVRLLVAEALELARRDGQEEVDHAVLRSYIPEESLTDEEITEALEALN